jgi:hypothetical protein
MTSLPVTAEQSGRVAPPTVACSYFTVQGALELPSMSILMSPLPMNRLTSDSVGVIFANLDGQIRVVVELCESSSKTDTPLGVLQGRVTLNS